MKALRTHAHSEGKGHRNDDFMAAFSILSTRELVIIGDFTSDSPQGANHRLAQQIHLFVEKRIKTWREHLIPPGDILGLMARFINRELQQHRDSGQTTLCACIVDTYENALYIVNIGDSGFGISQQEQFKFLRKGDVDGSRDASGFLPVNSETFAVTKTSFPPGAKLLLFTDGFWENTAHFMPPAQAQTKLSQIFDQPTLKGIVNQFHKDILEPSNRRDDFTFIIVKEEPVAHQEGDHPMPSMQQLDAYVEKKVFEALDRQEVQKPVQPSPLEKDLIRLLGKTTTGLQGMEKRVLKAVQDSNQKHHLRLAKELKESLDVYFQTLQHLRQDLEATRTELADQDFKFERRFEETEGLFGVQAVAQPLPRPSSGTTGKVQSDIRLLKKFMEDVDLSHLKDFDFDGLNQRLDALETETGLRDDIQDVNNPSQSLAATGSLQKIHKKHGWLWQLVNSLLLILLLGLFFFARGGKPKPQESQPSETVTQASQPTPVAPSSSPKTFEELKKSSVLANQGFQITWPEKLTPLRPPNRLLQFMGLSQERAQEELIFLANAVAKAKKELRAAGEAAKETREITIPFEGNTIAGNGSFNLYIRSKSSPANKTVLHSWLKPYAASDSQFPPARNLKAIWLQIHGNASVIDGDFGGKSRDALQVVLQNKMRQESHAGFSQALKTWLQSDSQKLSESLLSQTAAFFNLSDGNQVRQMVEAVRESLKQDQPYLQGSEIFIPKGSQDSPNVRKVLAKAGKATPLGTWLHGYGNKGVTPMREPYLVFLANQLGLSVVDGTSAPVLDALNAFKGQKLGDVLTETTASNQTWSQP